MKKYLCLILCAALLIPSFPLCTQEDKKVWSNPFSDVKKDEWYYTAVSGLNYMGIIESDENFNPESEESRIGILSYLYALYLKNGGKASEGEQIFKDIPKDSEYFDVASWAYKNGIANGEENSNFKPYKSVTREQLAVFLIRYAEKFDIALPKFSEPTQFKDSLNVNSYARTPVAVCKMAGIISGSENGYLYPSETVKKNEAASVLYSFIMAAQLKSKAEEKIETEAGIYDRLYDLYEEIPYVTRVAESPAVDISYFDNCAFVGDSVSLALKHYCDATGALGNTIFLAATSMSASNALRPLNSVNSIHPSYKGVKMTIEDAIAESGVDNVYIMLGVNGIANTGHESEIQYTSELASKILEKSPDVEILIQSVTPMGLGSVSLSQRLNNETITQYNNQMEKICSENGWYYVNVAEAVSDEEGYLKKEYCSDPQGQAIHFSTSGLKVWIDYLKTHVPEILKK